METLDVLVGTKNTTKKDSKMTHLESVALGLLALTMKSDFFKQQLMQQLYEHDLILTDSSETPGDDLDYENIEFIPFISPEVAVRKLSWLCNEIGFASKNEKQRIVRVLSLTYKNPIPQMAAWGFIFNETLGVFVAGHPFNIDSCLEYSQVIILGPNWQKFESQNITKQVNRISLMTLTKCIEEAKFNLKRIDPEVSSWLFEGSGLELYCAENESDYKEILVRMHNCGQPYISLSEDVDLIALRPSVTGSYEILLANLTAL
jgi:hypothetical protein